MDELDDTSPMPFGIHKHKPMSEVPVTYLHWFWHKCCPPNNDMGKQVEAYIEKNLLALKEENNDLIWSKK